MKIFKVFKDILDILKSIWVNIKGSKKLMGEYEIIEQLKDLNMKEFKVFKYILDMSLNILRICNKKLCSA
jgi:hypothetical protein